MHIKKFENLFTDLPTTSTYYVVLTNTADYNTIDFFLTEKEAQEEYTKTCGESGTKTLLKVNGKGSVYLGADLDVNGNITILEDDDCFEDL